MENLSISQKIAQKVGVKAGPNTYFLDESGNGDITDPRNVNIYTELAPKKSNVIKALGTITVKDLPSVVKATVQNELNKVK